MYTCMRFSESGNVSIVSLHLTWAEKYCLCRAYVLDLISGLHLFKIILKMATVCFRSTCVFRLLLYIISCNHTCGCCQFRYFR